MKRLYTAVGGGEPLRTRSGVTTRGRGTSPDWRPLQSEGAERGERGSDLPAHCEGVCRLQGVLRRSDRFLATAVVEKRLEVTSLLLFLHHMRVQTLRLKPVSPTRPWCLRNGLVSNFTSLLHFTAACIVLLVGDTNNLTCFPTQPSEPITCTAALIHWRCFKRIGLERRGGAFKSLGNSTVHRCT